MMTFAVIQLNGAGEPDVLAHFKNINDANEHCARMRENNKDYDYVFHVIMLPKAR